MATRIRLRRVGKKNQPSYRIVVIDDRKDGKGDYIEALGYYNSRSNPKILEINAERIQYWLSVGAKPTETVKGLLKQKKLG